jgi:hypothetical protein
MARGTTQPGDPSASATRTVALVLLAALPLSLQGALALVPGVRELLPGGVGTTRILAALFLLCDLAVSIALVMLLVMGDPRAVPDEDRKGQVGARVWRVLLGLAILSYAGLSPFFLFLYLRLR